MLTWLCGGDKIITVPRVREKQECVSHHAAFLDRPDSKLGEVWGRLSMRQSSTVLIGKEGVITVDEES